MHLCRSTGWVEIVLVQLSWTTASRHGVVAHHRYERQTSRSRQATAEDHGGCMHLVVRKNVHQHVGTLLHKPNNLLR